MIRGLHAMFVARFDPQAKDGDVTARHLKAKIKDALDEVPNIDDDTIVRRYVNLIEASVRTNHFAPAEKDQPRSLAVKLDARAAMDVDDGAGVMDAYANETWKKRQRPTRRRLGVGFDHSRRPHARSQAS